MTYNVFGGTLNPTLLLLLLHAARRSCGRRTPRNHPIMATDAGVHWPLVPLLAAATCELPLLNSLRLARLVQRCGVCGLDKYYVCQKP